MSLENFKSFVRERPSLNNYVQNGNMSWQKFYEMYELYGDKSRVWDQFLNTTSQSSSSFSLKDVFSTFKNMDMNELQKGITSVQKGLDYVKDMFESKAKNIPNKKPYEPRPLYKYFDD